MKATLLCALTLLTIQLFAQTPFVQNPPAGTTDGVNYLSDHSVVLYFFAPNKSYVHAIGDWNNWTTDNNSLMNVSEDGAIHWLQVDGLLAGEPYRYQYMVEGELQCADPYSELILDEWNDQWIPSDHYPGMLGYPFGETSWPVSVLQTAAPEYEWNDQNYQRPPQDRLMIYELLIRDFDEGQEISDVLDRLDYLTDLGITAIELMPVVEFDGNLSWGYSSNFFFAPDKYYGSKRKLQELVDECHQRGIAVIMDVVMNHSFGLNPHVRMYFDPDAGGYGQPTADNPWFNQQAPHPFSVGYDYDHESPITRDFFKRVLNHWLAEYHLDGYRIDLSKGLTQFNSGGDIGLWNQYDQSRVNILFDYANDVWSNHPGTFMILEHLGDNPEEQALANGGFMLWGKMTDAYKDATMGWGGDLNWGAWTNRGYSWPNLVTYFESHDEERIMVEVLNYGNGSGGYQTTDLSTALDRVEMAHAFLNLIPGPKMSWMWGEMGYDESIELCGDGSYNSSCRTDEKPAHWEYLNDPDRRRLYKIVRALNHLKKDHDVFSSYNFNTDLSGNGKRLMLYDGSMNAVVAGNFDVVGFDMVPGFNHTGTWYDYLTGDAWTVNSITDAFYFGPGEYHIWTDQPLPAPDVDGATPIFTAPGCTDPNAENYDPNADVDNGSCLYNVSLEVDASLITVHALGIHVAGSFQGWSPEALTDLGNGRWGTTVQIGAGVEMQYKYLNGPDWASEETVPEGCGISNGLGGFNRVWVTESNSNSIPVHCFNECGVCDLPPVDVTFQVDASQLTVAPEGIHIAGNFQGWDPSATVMVDQGNGVWSYTTSLEPGTILSYKYINGIDWAASETVPAECGIDDGGGIYNRSWTVGSQNEIIDLHCFSACSACEAGPETVSVCFKVDIGLAPMNIAGVHLAGSFQGWDPAATSMTNIDYGLYEVCLQLPVNTTFEYKFINGNAWGQDESVPSPCANVANNREVVVGTTDLDLGVVCFGACEACGGCTDPGYEEYNPYATEDGSCTTPVSGTPGCTYASAANYDPEATEDDGSCLFGGCLDPLAVNYDPQADVDDGTCVFGDQFCGANTQWDPVFQTCVGEEVVVCQGDLNGDSTVNVADLLTMLAIFGTECE